MSFKCFFITLAHNALHPFSVDPASPAVARRLLHRNKNVGILCGHRRLRDWSYAELDVEQSTTVPSALPLLAYGTAEPASRRCHFTVAGNFQETAKTF